MDKLTFLVGAATEPRRPVTYKVNKTLHTRKRSEDHEYLAHAQCLLDRLDRSVGDGRIRTPLGWYVPKTKELCQLCQQPLMDS